ncbi:3-oxoacyl-ACP synthase [Streptomyces sp. NWU49]|uniref:3-oxoacyl-(Acyl-carrier-protein) synthase n=1 Tax=Streptomyces viridosporus (strain ATCC 14672 / DSM 40746 / JCM 4963 / KCTC 9882 / NRRL B-12104 / FH 1290) TaxID=566461 RepID=D5ZQM5_STRV1|nr:MULTISPECIES: 3-oxoacyl-[acyl-carrier-protein] synthase III C-terminal domain-containing protein [Streptomyces]EFE66440.1 3-oxoacyl-(acyl-carrier-protein) synthase [Streptomyces viridosporus ATCC 14672]PWJ05925.1 3-oxoacyl-ACP synthase [Streptomyces sp. NWU49]
MPEALRARIAAVSAHLPSRYRTLDETRVKVAETGGYAPPPGLLEDLTGVRGVHVHEDGANASDLAVTAARSALDEAGLKIGDVDLLLFAATSQDLIEPATAHLVATKLGASCPVFDVKNACNSFLNAMEVAASFIENGRYRTVLIACGELSTLATRWHVPDRQDLLRALPGYTASDAGAAMVLTAGPAGERDPGVLALRFASNSDAWEACTVAGGGSMHHLSVHDDHTTLRLNGDLRQGALDAAPRILATAGEELETVRTSAFVAFHQIAMPQYREMLELFSLPEDRCMPAVAEHGNCAAASLPLQLVKAREADRIESGDLVAMIGLASGFSFGLALVRW